MSAPRPLLACADDLGADADNDAVILALLQDRRLSGASVLVDGPNAAVAARAPGDRLLGLHLNLTQSFGQAFAVRSVAAWIVTAWSGRIGRDPALRAALGAEIDRQLARFSALAGRVPDYVDGHEHVHGLPGVAALLAERLAAAGTPVPVRSVRAQRWRGAKAELISRLCGRTATATLNDDFIGVYPLDASAPYSQRVRAWLASAQGRPLLMCHPGTARGAMPHGAARAAEFAFFSSELWPETCRAAGFVPTGADARLWSG